ncbi:MAG: eukaryotic-like serine/threonine-protein kinase [Thermoanaerobaculia bacterium]|nr:eukaryotic-like serine/threonine-protein kinase [Thermoanaerobaculia bacterium]
MRSPMLQPDAMLGPYRIVSLLGEGGMGAVYRARDTRLGRDVAVKILTALTLSDQERIQRFEQEARATGMLNHPNLLTIYDVGNENGTAYIVSELLEGETLRERLERGPLPPRRAIDAALQVANGLAAAHEKGIIHRDLKPDNIFLTRDGRAKILDFGIAKLSATSDDGGLFPQAATEPGMVLGTVGYMSPEQVRGEKVDTRSDIFAFGAILYEMLTGVRAFKRNSSIETLSAILKEDPPDLSESLPNVPPALERLSRRCLEKDRDHRFQSARDLAFNLETMSATSTPGTYSSIPVPAMSGASTAQTPTMRVQDATAESRRTSATAARPATAAMPATTRIPVRHATIAQPVPRRVSPLLLTLLFLAAIGGAAFAGWYFATNKMKEEAPPEVVFHRMTFRKGEVRMARFGPDGDSIIYSAAWDGNPTEIFVANRQSPEPRPLGVKDADVLAVSKSTELAVLLRRDRLTGLGTLARVPVAGGSPREVAEQVLQADWSADGTNLIAIRGGAGTFRIESPVGKVVYETPHQLRDIRMAPDGRIAFVESFAGKNDVSILDSKSGKPVSIARGWSHGVTGLAWAPGGKEIWITATDTGAPPALYAVNIETGDSRLVNRLTGSMRLYDISPAGHLLLSHGMWRAALEVQAPGESAERDLSWLDWSMLADLSRDGKTLLFNEPREGGGAASSMFLRKLDAPTPVRIADGYGDALSPDGKYVLGHNGAKLVVVPTGSGEARELKTEGAFDLGAAWLPDGRRVVIAGALPKKGYQLHVIDTLDETAKPISPENIWGDAYRPFAVSPDGRYVAGMTKQQTIALYPVDANAEPSIVPAIEPGEVPITWSADGASLFVYHPTALPAQVTRVTLATGAREPWKQFSPTEPAGVYKIAPICITPDGTAYAYDALRMAGDLYVADGLR